jgi:hypothetical protein
MVQVGPELGKEPRFFRRADRDNHTPIRHPLIPRFLFGDCVIPSAQAKHGNGSRRCTIAEVGSLLSALKKKQRDKDAFLAYHDAVI